MRRVFASLLAIHIPLACHAIDPSAPVCRVAGGEIVQTAASIPLRWGADPRYDLAGPDRWIADGWANYTVTTNVNVQTVEIPATIRQIAAVYREIMERVMGSGAHTNAAITREQVAATLIIDPSATAEDGARLDAGREFLVTFNGQTGRQPFAWDFPFGAQTVAVTNKVSSVTVINE